MISRVRALVLSLTACLLSAACAADDATAFRATLDVSLSSREVQIAEPFQLQIDCIVDDGVQVKLPELGQRWGRFDVRGKIDRFDIPEGDGQRRWSRELTLETLETGDLSTPALEVLATRDGVTQRLSAPPQSLQVSSVLEPNADLAKIRDIKPLIDPITANDSASSRWWLWPTIGAAFALGWGVHHWRGRRGMLTPRQWAIRELEKLASDAAGEEAFEQMTLIVGRFLHWQLDLEAVSWTPDELLRAPQLVEQLGKTQRAELQALLELADQVKYAGAKPSKSETLEAIQRCRRFVERVEPMDPMDPMDRIERLEHARETNSRTQTFDADSEMSINAPSDHPKA